MPPWVEGEPGAESGSECVQRRGGDHDAEAGRAPWFHACGFTAYKVPYAALPGWRRERAPRHS